MADTEVRSRPSWSTVTAAVLIYVATGPFVYYAIRLAVMRGELDNLLQRDDLIFDGGAVESFKSFTVVVILCFGAASLIAIVLSRRLLRRSPGAREMARLFFGLMVGASVIVAMFAVAVEAPSGTSAAILGVGFLDAVIVGLLSLRPSREEFEKLSLERWERRYFKDLERTRRKEERLRQKAAKNG